MGKVKCANPPSPLPSTIEEYLQNICVAMQKACEEIIPLKAFLRLKRPGWNSSANAAHRCSKAAWKQWKWVGRPSDPTNPVRESYLKAKREFHNALRTWKWDQDFSFYTSLDLNHSYFNSYVPNLVPSQTWLIIFLSTRVLRKWDPWRMGYPLWKPSDHDNDQSFLNIVDEELTNMTSQFHEQPNITQWNLRRKSL